MLKILCSMFLQIDVLTLLIICFRITSVVSTLVIHLSDTRVQGSGDQVSARERLKFQSTTRLALLLADKSSGILSISTSRSSRMCWNRQCPPRSTRHHHSISTHRRRRSCHNRQRSRAIPGPCITTTLLIHSSSSSSSSHSRLEVAEPGRYQFSTFPPTTSLPALGSSSLPSRQVSKCHLTPPRLLALRERPRSTLYP